MRYKNSLRLLSLGFLATCVQKSYAKCGNVDYSWGADALANAHDYIVTMMLYCLYLIYAIASIVVIYASLQIYIKKIGRASCRERV